jgi:dihydrodipicolinate reductase
MNTTYDQKTLNKVYSELRREKLKMERLSLGFQKEAKRYKKLKDNTNMVVAMNSSIGFDLVSNQIEKVITQLKTNFKKKNATKRI